MKKNIKLISLIIIVLAIVFALYYIIGCPIRFLTGMPCPGCGMRHAAFYLIMGNVNEALLWHPLIFIMPIVAIVCLFYKRFSKKSLIAMAIFVAIIFVAVYILRFINPDDAIIKWDLSQSIWHRWMHIL